MLVTSLGYLGDFMPGDTLSLGFATSAALAGGRVRVVKQGNAAVSTAGVKLVDNPITGADLTIDTSADQAFYQAGRDYVIALSEGKVDGKSVEGEVIGVFSLGKRPHLPRAVLP